MTIFHMMFGILFEGCTGSPKSYHQSVLFVKVWFFEQSYWNIWTNFFSHVLFTSKISLMSIFLVKTSVSFSLLYVQFYFLLNVANHFPIFWSVLEVILWPHHSPSWMPFLLLKNHLTCTKSCVLLTNYHKVCVV